MHRGRYGATIYNEEIGQPYISLRQAAQSPAIPKPSYASSELVSRNLPFLLYWKSSANAPQHLGIFGGTL